MPHIPKHVRRISLTSDIHAAPRELIARRAGITSKGPIAAIGPTAMRLNAVAHPVRTVEI
jgi:hypothetical protein